MAAAALMAAALRKKKEGGKRESVYKWWTKGVLLTPHMGDGIKITCNIHTLPIGILVYASAAAVFCCTLRIISGEHLNTLRCAGTQNTFGVNPSFSNVSKCGRVLKHI